MKNPQDKRSEDFDLIFPSLEDLFSTQTLDTPETTSKLTPQSWTEDLFAFLDAEIIPNSESTQNQNNQETNPPVIRIKHE